MNGDAFLSLTPFEEIVSLEHFLYLLTTSIEKFLIFVEKKVEENVSLEHFLYLLTTSIEKFLIFVEKGK